MLYSDHKNKYVNYRSEEFLSDTFFIRSMKEPTEESENFWSNSRKGIRPI